MLWVTSWPRAACPVPTLPCVPGSVLGQELGDGTAQPEVGDHKPARFPRRGAPKGSSPQKVFGMRSPKNQLPHPKDLHGVNVGERRLGLSIASCSPQLP